MSELLRKATPEEQLAEVTRGAVDVHTREDLLKKLQASYEKRSPLRVKMGFDPTAPDLHLGHTVPLERMRRFQDLGHTVIFLIGDFTASIGDPTGRNTTRPPLSDEQIAANAETYKKQVFKILDQDRTEVRFNSEWLTPLGSAGLIKLAARYTLARMLEREDFKKRWQSETPIALHELLYPLAQGYDSVALKADVELGSSDQLFNLLVGRQLPKEYRQPPQVSLTGPLLEGLDAREVDGKFVGDKMSKSAGNYVGIDEPAQEQYGKLMSISDGLMWRYYELLSRRSLAEIDALRREHPKTAKSELAKEIVARYHGPEAARAAEEQFELVHKRREVPEDVEERVVSREAGADAVPLAKTLAQLGLAASGSEARRLIAQGGVSIDGDRDRPRNPGLGTDVVHLSSAGAGQGAGISRPGGALGRRHVPVLQRQEGRRLLPRERRGPGRFHSDDLAPAHAGRRRARRGISRVRHRRRYAVGTRRVRGRGNGAALAALGAGDRSRPGRAPRPVARKRGRHGNGQARIGCPADPHLAVHLGPRCSSAQDPVLTGGPRAPPLRQQGEGGGYRPARLDHPRHGGRGGSVRHGRAPRRHVSACAARPDPGRAAQ